MKINTLSQIKREIERRGWYWGGESHSDSWYWFRIWKEEPTKDPLQIKVTILGEGYKQTPELAACQAFDVALKEK